MVRDPAAVARFNREASNASRIDDDNVARVYDFGEATGGTVYLAMEYVNGRTLRDMIVEEGAIDARRTADLVEQIARGLDAAHRLKIIHRDLKPDNVMVVSGPDGREKVKVVDFGIAKAFGAGDGGLTKTGFVCRHAGVHEPGAAAWRRARRAQRRVRIGAARISMPDGGAAVRRRHAGEVDDGAPDVGAKPVG